MSVDGQHTRLHPHTRVVLSAEERAGDGHKPETSVVHVIGSGVKESEDAAKVHDIVSSRSTHTRKAHSNVAVGPNGLIS